MEPWLILGCVAVLAGCSIERARFTENGAPLDARGADAAAIASDAPPDASPDAPPALGSKGNPARSCTELKDLGLPSGSYWVKPSADPVEVYCEQQLNGGGWALLANSVRKADGTTTAFWDIGYEQRFAERGVRSPADNYYYGELYKFGIRYFDYIVDLKDAGALAAEMTATAIDKDSMKFANPVQVAGNLKIFQWQFASGWAAPDRDLDPYSGNCAVYYTNVTQHYGSCWVYSFGSDAGSAADWRDGGVGPHVHDDELVDLGLSLQAGSQSYSQVKRIARFVRW